jgi:streptomycin 6-kinase
MSTLTVSDSLRRACKNTPEGASWLARLPAAVEELIGRWQLSPAAPLGGEEGSCSWVQAVMRLDGTRAVLKLGLPHMESEQEADALRLWDGGSAVRLLEADAELGALLLERCDPGTSLRTRPEPEQDHVIAAVLQCLWRAAPSPAFRPLSRMLRYWSERARGRASTERQPTARRWTDAGLLREGLRLFEELPESAPAQVLLATDLHAGNVLEGRRQPWLAIDPKPFVGDPAYDATQHLLNCTARLGADADRTIRSFSELLGVDHERVRLWTFARLATETHADHERTDALSLARALAP